MHGLWYRTAVSTSAVDGRASTQRTYVPMSAMQHVIPSLFTRMFLLLRSLCAMAGFPARQTVKLCFRSTAVKLCARAKRLEYRVFNSITLSPIPPTDCWLDITYYVIMTRHNVLCYYYYNSYSEVNIARNNSLLIYIAIDFSCPFLWQGRLISAERERCSVKRAVSTTQTDRVGSDRQTVGMVTGYASETTQTLPNQPSQWHAVNKPTAST